MEIKILFQMFQTRSVTHDLQATFVSADFSCEITASLNLIGFANELPIRLEKSEFMRYVP